MRKKNMREILPLFIFLGKQLGIINEELEKNGLHLRYEEGMYQYYHKDTSGVE